MIKIDNNLFYLTAGDTCSIFRADADGRIGSTYFGKRVEPEDDVFTLGCASIDTHGSEFVLDGAEIAEEKPPDDIPMLGGGKTLIITLTDAKRKLRKKVFATPYSRGGIGVRTVIINDGKKPIELDPSTPIAAFPLGTDLITLSSNGNVERRNIVAPSAKDRAKDEITRCGNFISAVAHDCTESHGYAYGFLCAYGNGELEYAVSDSGLEIKCSDGDKIHIGVGESHCLPETLVVFSENGIGGVTRTFHDILREYMCEKRAERCPIVLFSPLNDTEKTDERVRAASELGCDTFVVNADKASAKTLKAVSDACKAADMKFGIKVCPSVKRDANIDSEVQQYIDALEKKIVEYGIEYVLIDLPRVGVKKYARAVFNMRKTLARKLPDILIEWGTIPEEKRYAQTVCYPVCIMRSVIDTDGGALKTKFDAATFGCPAYECDPLALGDDIKRAIRAQIFSYQDDARITLGGDIYRPKCYNGDKCLIAVSKDKSKAYALAMSDGASPRIYFDGLDEHNLYNVRELGKTFSGAALMFCGVALPSAQTQDGNKISYTLHLRQVADFDN